MNAMEMSDRSLTSPPEFDDKSSIVHPHSRRQVEEIYEMLLRGELVAVQNGLERLLFDRVGNNEIKVRVKRDLNAAKSEVLDCRKFPQSELAT